MLNKFKKCSQLILKILKNIFQKNFLNFIFQNSQEGDIIQSTHTTEMSYVYFRFDNS